MNGLARSGWLLIVAIVAGSAAIITWAAWRPLADRWHRQTCVPHPDAIEGEELFHHTLPPCDVFYDEEFEQDGEGWELTKPTRVVINSLGFRNRDYAPAKGADTKRIILLGDSFTYGFGVELEDTFFVLLEEQLRASLDRDVEVWNIGNVSWGTVVQLRVVEERIERFDPDLVLLLFDYSDFADNQVYDAALSADGKRFEVMSMEDFNERRIQAWRQLPREDIEPTLARLAASNQALELSGDYIIRVAEHLEGRGIPFAAVFYPYPFQRVGYEGELLGEFYYQLAAAGVAWYSLYPFFGPSERESLFQSNNHWNAAGSRYVAGLLHEYITAHQWAAMQ